MAADFVGLLPFLREETDRFAERCRNAHDNPSKLKVLEEWHLCVHKIVESYGPQIRDSVAACVVSLDVARSKLDEAKKLMQASDVNEGGRFLQKNMGKLRLFGTAKRTRKLLDGAEAELSRVKEHLEWELNLPVGEDGEEGFCRHFATPQLPPNVYFDENDTQSNFGKLKRLVLSERDSASGECTAVYCARGPGGMGKTVTLKKICQDVDVKERFIDGIHYLSLGQEAGSVQLLNELGKCARNVKFKSFEEELGSASISATTDINRNINKFNSVFTGKRVLFVLDDLWNQHRSFLENIAGMLNHGDGCAVVISTRHEDVALNANESVKFDYLKADGSESESILLSRVQRSVKNELLGYMDENRDVRGVFDSGLRECGGWVLCLSIAGVHLRNLTEQHAGDVGLAINVWESDLNTGVVNMTERSAPMYDLTLRVVVRKSLSFCETKWRELCGCGDAEAGNRASHCFTSLCVMQKQKTLSRSALSHVWEMSIEETRRMSEILCDACLGSMTWSEGKRFGLHDKLIDVSRTMADGRGGCAVYHQRLLNGYRSDRTQISVGEWGRCREWWKELDVDDDFVAENVGYHLAEGRLYDELWCLLTDVRWVLRWRREGRGWVGISKDFERCLRSGMSWAHVDCARGLEKVHQALHDSWMRFSRNEHALGFEIYGRLCTLKEPSVKKFLLSIASWGPSPWLRPCLPYLRERDSRQETMTRIPYREFIYSPSGCYAAVMVENDEVSVFDTRRQVFIHRCTVPENSDYMRAQSEDGCQIVTSTEDGMLYVTVFKDNSGTDHVRLGEHRGVRTAAFSADGTRVVSGGHDSTVRVWNVEDGNAVGEALTLEGHEYGVQCVAFSADGKRVVSGGRDSTVRVWNVEDGNAVGEALTLEGHEDWVQCVAFSADGKRVVSGGHDKTVRVWNVEDGNAVGEALTLEGHEYGVVQCVAFSADGKRVVSGGHDKTVRVWNVEDGNAVGEALTLEGHDEYGVQCVAFSADGKRVVSGGHDNTVRVWNVEDGNAVGEALTLEGHEYWVQCVAFSADGKRVVSGAHDKTVRVWNVEDGNAVGEALTLEGHEDWVQCVAFSADGKRVVSGGRDRTVRVWNVEDGNAVGEGLTLEGHEYGVQCVAFSADGKRVVSGGRDNTVRVWNVEDGNAVGEALTLEGHEDWVQCVAFSADGKRVVSGGDDSAVRVWNVEDGGLVTAGEPFSTTMTAGESELFWKRYKRWFSGVLQAFEVDAGSDGEAESGELDRCVRKILAELGVAEAEETGAVGFSVTSSSVTAQCANGKIVLAEMIGGCYAYTWGPERRVTAHGLVSGKVVICRIVESGSCVH